MHGYLGNEVWRDNHGCWAFLHKIFGNTGVGVASVSRIIDQRTGVVGFIRKGKQRPSMIKFWSVKSIFWIYIINKVFLLKKYFFVSINLHSTVLYPIRDFNRNLKLYEIILDKNNFMLMFTVVSCGC